MEKNLLVLLMLIIQFSSFGFADEIRSDYFIFMSPISYAPWVIVNSDKTVSGAMVDYATEISKEVNLDYKFEHVPFARFINILESGKVNFDITLVDDSVKIADTKLVKIKNPFSESRVVLFYKKELENCGRIKNYVNINFKTSSKIVDETCGSNAIETKVSTFEQRYKMLFSGRADAVIVGTAELQDMNKNDLTRILRDFKTKLLKKSLTHLYIKRGSVLDKKNIIESLEQFSKNKYKENISKMPHVIHRM